MTTKLTIRSKLAAALAVPLIALTVVVGFQLRDSSMYLLAAAGSVALSVFVLYLANVWITKPLRALADEALEVANVRLPEVVGQVLAAPAADAAVHLQPVIGRGGAEISDVADALNVLQQKAVDLATEQAALRRSIADALVNLGRRTQQLLSRQIELISTLESREQNPELLDQLFKLDHLATRMRRNAESLLVLAGEEAPRQWRAAQPVGDLVRAALGEVEDFSRVRIHQLDNTTVVGHAVADLSHVLAELLENGLTFSPPDSVVDLYGRITPNGYVISVNDHGIGMTPEELARANERLVTSSSLTLAPSRYLGHYVVGQLTMRHAVAVALTESPGGGVTATIVLPPALVEGFEGPAATSVFVFENFEPDARPEPEPEPEAEPDGIRAPAYLDEPVPVDEPVPAAAVHFDFESIEADPETEPEPVPEPEPPAPESTAPAAPRVSSFLIPAAQQQAVFGEEAPKPEPEASPVPVRTAAGALPAGEPYPGLVADRNEREAEADAVIGAIGDVIGAGDLVKEMNAVPYFVDANVDDLLPKLPRRRDGGRKTAPALTAAVAPPTPLTTPSNGYAAEASDSETEAETETEARSENGEAPAAPTAPLSDEMQSNMAAYAAFRAAADRGREDAHRP